MNDALLTMIFQGILGYVVLPYVLWRLTHKSHNISERSGIIKYVLIYEVLATVYFILPDFLKLLYLALMIFVLNHKFFKLNLIQSFLTSFIFMVIFLTSEIVSEMVGQIANIIIGNFASELGFLYSIKCLLQALICLWMIRSFEPEFSMLILKRGQLNK